MNFTSNTFIGIVTALSGIIIAFISSYVARQKDSEGVITRREEAISAEMWKIIAELKQSVKETREENERLSVKIDDLEEQLQVSRASESTLRIENMRMSARITDLEKIVSTN